MTSAIDVDLERLVRERLLAVLAPDVRPYPNVRWVDRSRPNGPARDGELDLVLVDPVRGILALEVKGGVVSRDAYGRWFAGRRHLEENPFRQVETGKHVLERKIAAHPDWHAPKPRLLHVVAFPQSDREDLLRHHRDLGPEAPLDLVIDRADLETPASTAAALVRVFAFWSGDGVRDRTLTAEQLTTIHDVIEPDVVLRALLHADLDEGERAILAPTHHQLHLLRTLACERRASIVGGAGSGKTLLAIEKARSLAATGFDVLLVCFNSPLAGTLGAHPELAPHIASGRLAVQTYHQLARWLALEAGVLPPEPAHPTQDWWDRALPEALDAAIGRLDRRWQAVVVDEGQDFAPGWLESLDLLLVEPGIDDLYLFHDPAQSLYRPDATATLGLKEFPLPDNCRNARPIHDFAYRHCAGIEAEPMREDGRPVEIVEAEPGDPTVEAVREALHRLVREEGVERGRIGVLVGQALEHSALWRRRRLKGGLELWNGSVDGAGHSLGLRSDLVPRQPAGTIAIETIHRAKGLEWDVVVLAELRPDDARLEMLLYIGASRAKHHLVVIAPPELARRLEAQR